jgi:hypothetical protein
VCVRHGHRTVVTADVDREGRNLLDTGPLPRLVEIDVPGNRFGVVKPPFPHGPLAAHGGATLVSATLGVV